MGCRRRHPRSSAGRQHRAARLPGRNHLGAAARGASGRVAGRRTRFLSQYLPSSTPSDAVPLSPVTVAPNDFVHLHLHSEFSLLDGLGRINDLAEQGSHLGFDAMAITDHGALYGAVAFVQAVSAKGMKPIVGIETYVARRSMRDKEGKADSQPFHLVLLAENWEGYQNLCRLATDAHLEGYYYKPRIDREHLAKHSKGLIGLSACLSGEIPKALEVDDWEMARKLAGEYKDIFGPDRFFLELQDHGLAQQLRLNEQLLRLGPEVGLKHVVTNDLHYVGASSRKPTMYCCASAPATTSIRRGGCGLGRTSST